MRPETPGSLLIPASTNPVRPWSMLAAVLALMILSLLLRVIHFEALLEQLSGPHRWAEVIWWNILVPLGVIAFATVGALIVSRDPGNRLGWLALSLAILAPVNDIVWQYAIRAAHLVAVSPPAEGMVFWLAHVFKPVMLVLFYGLVLLHFPDGRLASQRWRLVIWLALGIAGLNIVEGTTSALTGEPIEIIRPSALTIDLNSGFSGWIHALVEFLTASVVLLGIVSIFVRWRGATGLDRQRLKWLGYAGSMIFFSLAGWFIVISWSGDSYLSFALLSLNLAMFTVGVPVAIGIAILRYQLFDIDIVINRTLVYSLVMVLLAIVYAAGVLVLQQVFGSIAGSSGIAVATSTLGVVALFQPLRTHVQTWVDRRFYRTRYDASRALTRFGYAANEEIDLDQLQATMTDLINETMRPHCITIWLAEPEGDLSRESRIGHAD